MPNPEPEQGRAALPVAEIYVNFESNGLEVNVTVRGARDPVDLLDRAYQAMQSVLA